MERGRKQVGVLRPGALLCSSSPKVNIQMSQVLKFRCHGWVDLMCKLLAGVALGGLTAQVGGSVAGPSFSDSNDDQGFGVSCT